MEQTSRLSTSIIFIMGIMMLVVGTLAIITHLDMVGAVILIIVGIIGIVGGLIDLFEKKKQY